METQTSSDCRISAILWLVEVEAPSKMREQSGNSGKESSKIGVSNGAERSFLLEPYPVRPYCTYLMHVDIIKHLDIKRLENTQKVQLVAFRKEIGASAVLMLAMTMMLFSMLILSLFIALGDASCFLSPLSTRRARNDEVTLLMLADDDDVTNRRSFLATSLVGFLGASTAAAAPPMIVHAGIDPTALKNLPVEGDTAGTATRLLQIEAIQKPAADEVDKPWEDLPSGVSFRDYREGRGQQGSYTL